MLKDYAYLWYVILEISEHFIFFYKIAKIKRRRMLHVSSIQRTSFRKSGSIYKFARQRFKFDKLRSRSLMHQEQLFPSSFAFRSCFNRLCNQNDKKKKLEENLCTRLPERKTFLFKKIVVIKIDDEALVLSPPFMHFYYCYHYII